VTKYFGIHLKIFVFLALKRKVSLQKVINYFLAKISRLLRLSKPLNYPVLVNIELWNECNEACLFCRSRDGLIYRGDGTGVGVPKGQAKLDRIIESLETLKDRLLFAVPYVNGEPLISPLLADVLFYLKDNRVASVIASNGIALDRRRRKLLIDADLDLLKVHNSGMTNDIHRIEHRSGDVDRILRNLRILSADVRETGSRMLIMLDYIKYNHNEHQIAAAETFAREHGIIFNIRPGNPEFLDDETDNSLPPVKSSLPCDWVWEALTLDWDDAVLPCCDFVIWRNQYSSTKSKDVSIKEQWFTEHLFEFRKSLVKNGRSHNEACKGCSKTSVGFKY